MNFPSKKAYTFIIIFICFLFSCAHKTENDPTAPFLAKPTNRLHGERIHLREDSALNDPRSIMVFDTIGIFNDNDGNTGFSIVNLNSGALIKRFGCAGNADNEFNINALGIDRLNDSGEFTIFQSNLPRRIFKYNLDSLLKSRIYKPKYYYQFSGKLSFDQALLYNDSTFTGIGSLQFKNNIFGILQSRSKKFTLSGPLPYNANEEEALYYKEILPWTLSVLNGKILRKPGSNRLAYFSNKGAVISVADVDHEFKFHKVFSVTYYLPKFHINVQGQVTAVMLMAGCRYGFIDVTCTKDRIYALFNPQLATSDNATSLSSNVILIYDWDGNAVEKMYLDNNVYSISIDPNHPNHSYALSILSNKGLFKYTIK